MVSVMRNHVSEVGFLLAKSQSTTYRFYSACTIYPKWHSIDYNTYIKCQLQPYLKMKMPDEPAVICAGCTAASAASTS